MVRLELIDREVDRQLLAHSQTVANLATRSSLIVTTAVVFVSLVYDRSVGSCPDLVSLCAFRTALHYGALGAAAVAAVLGVLALLMNPRGEEIDLDSLEGDLEGRSAGGALRSVIRGKSMTLAQDELTVKRREWKYRAALILLITALIATVAGTIVEDWM